MNSLRHHYLKLLGILEEHQQTPQRSGRPAPCLSALSGRDFAEGRNFYQPGTVANGRIGERCRTELVVVPGSGGRAVSGF